jgi:hypothetical protein
LGSPEKIVRSIPIFPWKVLKMENFFMAKKKEERERDFEIKVGC